MAELKRLFVGAKMDKDSNVRFVANGDYTDAVNIDIIHSEGGDAGIVRNKKGTTRQATQAFNTTTGVYEDWDAGAGLGAADDPYGWDSGVGIGIHKHTPTDTIYKFITANGVDTILEFQASNGVVKPVLVDTNNVLGWNSSTLITGIQIIEGTLGWVVQGKEPCAIDISVFKKATSNTTTHTQMGGGDFVLSDITMIRLSPLTAPGMTLSNTLRDGIIESATTKNFTVAGLNDGSLSVPGSIGDAISFVLPTGSAFIVGDKIKLTSPASSADTNTEIYEINLVVTATYTGGSDIRGTIISTTSQIEDNALTWEVNLVQAKPLFELVFPRFAYRWKYDNNQYSPFSPFTQVAFLADEYLFNSQKGYNLGMTNNVRKVTLDNFGTAPTNAVELDILYKESDSTAVYRVESLPISTTEYVITDELIHNLISENQLLRPWDVVPKSAIALEAVGNRFVLGNYKKGYNMDADIKFASALVDSTGILEVGTPEQSIKSLRTYQAGILFKDALGRETPIFTDKTGVMKTTLEDASTSNSIVLAMQGAPPTWATHFKYFIKDTANEYYNLAADRLYQTEDKLATWISFPSSERNKVTIDTYLIAKKFHDQDVPVTAEDNKFKIVDIQSEAPSEISSVKEQVIESKIYFDSNFGDGNTQTTRNVGSTPVPNSKVFLIAGDKNSASDGITTVLLDELVVGAYIRFKSGTSRSKYYKIASVLKSTEVPAGAFGLGGSTGVHAKVYVTDPFSEDVNFLYVDPSDSVSALVNTRVTMTVSTDQDLANQEQFTGRFFVKLASNAVLNNVFQTSSQFVTLNAANCYYGGNSGYINSDINFQIYAGGAYPRLNYSTLYTAGGLDVQENPSWALTNSDTIYDIVFEKRHRNPIDNDFIASINTVGTKIRFSNHSTVYTITETRTQTVSGGGGYDYTRYWTVFDKRLTADVSPHVTSTDITVEIVGTEDEAAFTSKNPAIFETEPAKGVELDIYHEASAAYPIAGYNDSKVLDYYNCFAFGNGVESNRIRDDYNAVTIDKGPKVSSVLDEPYGEEHIKNGMIFSGIYNSLSGVNNLNQFLIAEKITKEVSPIYGSIQYLHARDTDMIVYCEDKILQILANKDALYNADGSTNITASSAVLGDARPFVGEFGMSRDRASFASYGFRAYSTDSRRGVAIRLSRDGITPIVKGYENELETLFKANTGNIIGSYDDETGTYNMTVSGLTHQYSETSGGWTSTWEIAPEMGITLNNVYYTIKNGVLWSHDDETNRNTWYGEAAADSSITFVFNDGPSSIKKFKTLSYEGDSGWIASEIETNDQSGNVTTWELREGKYYNYIKGVANSWDNDDQTGNVDTAEFSVQGIGNVVSISGDTTATTFTINIFDDPADH